jgi:outer membrane lipoprotein SlyB
MKVVIGIAGIMFALATVTSAEAKGCLKGAAVGGAAGHYVGHHGVLGAMAGCVVGRHQANKRAQQGTDRDNRTKQGNRRSPREESM